MAKAADTASSTRDKGTETIYMLYLYPKNKQADLTPQQAKLLSRLVEEEFK